MNSSYKIVLLGAFVLFIGVIGYVAFFGGEPNPEAAANSPGTPPAQTPPPRDNPAPDPVRPAVPDWQTPPEREVTIGPTIDETPDEIVQPPDNVAEAGPGPLVATGDSELTAPDTGVRLGPSIDELLEGETPLGEGDLLGLGPDTTETTETGTDTTDSGAEETGEEATPPSDPAPTTSGDPPRIYKIKSGDTFSSIALEFYGDKKLWQDIALANPSVDPQRLQIDQEIVLPRRGEVDRDVEEPALPAPNGEQTYTVRAGDNLSRIAQKFYKDSEKWDLIYSRNRKTIGSKPDNLKVGMKLIIPQAFDTAD